MQLSLYVREELRGDEENISGHKKKRDIRRLLEEKKQ
jgi:hypothetical protein